MKPRLFYHFQIFIISLFVAIFIQPVWAEKIITPSSYLVEIGRMELEKGKIDDAIHEFKKALLVDPYNEEAKNELKKLGFADERYQGLQSTDQKLREFQEKVAQLENDKRAMEDKLQKAQIQQDRLHEIYAFRNLELEVLINKVAALKSLREQDRKKQLKQINQVAEYYADQTKDLKATVNQQKNEIINQHIALLMPNERKGINQSQIEESLLNLGYRVNQLDPMTQAKMDVQEKLIKAFTEYLELREQRFFEVENQMALNEIDKAKQQKMLVKKMDEIIKLQDNVDRYLERLNDRDALIVDKNKEAGLLENELLDAQKALEEKNQELENLKQQLKNKPSSTEQL